LFAAQWLLIGGVAFSQPGLCPCWLLADARHIHPHPFAHPERPHTHDYLIDLFGSLPSQVPPPLAVPDEVLAELQASGDLWLLAAGAAPGNPLWGDPPSSPPPRPASV
jgi:hypothetical protein